MTNALNITGEGLQVYAPTTGVFSAVDLAAKGDLLSYSTDYSVFNVGADDKKLIADSTQSTGLNWGDFTLVGSVRLLSTQTASSSATIDFTSIDDSTYDAFFVIIQNAHPATDNVTLECLMSVDNGSIFLSSGYAWIYDQYDTGSESGSIQNNSSDSTIDIADSVGNSTGEGISGRLWFYPASDPSNYMKNSINFHLIGGDNSTNFIMNYGSATNTTTSTVDALRFKFSSGNIEAGIFYLYGVKNS